MYAGEIIFLLLWMWAATGLVGDRLRLGARSGLGIFHILIVVLQAYIFMMLTIVYISMAHEQPLRPLLRHNSNPFTERNSKWTNFNCWR